MHQMTSLYTFFVQVCYISDRLRISLLCRGVLCAANVFISE